MEEESGDLKFNCNLFSKSPNDSEQVVFPISDYAPTLNASQSVREEMVYVTWKTPSEMECGCSG